jgi:hypothetical protein
MLSGFGLAYKLKAYNSEMAPVPASRIPLSPFNNIIATEVKSLQKYTRGRGECSR